MGEVTENQPQQDNPSPLEPEVARDELGRVVAGTPKPLNPTGVRCAARSITEHFNDLDRATEAEIRAIARDKTAPANKRAAATQWLDILASSGELADFEPFLDGTHDLRKLQREGVATRLAREAKVTTHTSDSGSETRREIKLSDKGADSLDRVLDRTGGKPHQSQSLQIHGAIQVAGASMVARLDPADLKVLAEMASRVQGKQSAE